MTGSATFRTLLFWALAAASSLQFAFAYTTTVVPAFSLRDYASGNVAFPFRRRILMKFFYQLGFHFSPYLSFTSRRAVVTPEMMLNVAVALTACLLTILTTRLFIAKLLGRRSMFLWFALLPVYIANYNLLLVHEIKVSTPYDLPSTAFFGLACYAAFTRNRWLFYPVFILATFNRESTLFLPLVFFLFGLREDLPLAQALRRSPWLYIETGLQLAVWRVILMTCERLTGGVGAPQPIFAYNLHLLMNPVHWPTFASVFGFLWIPYLLFFNRIGNIRLQRILWLVPLWAAIMLKYADPLEIRTNSEWTVYISVCIALIANASWTLRIPNLQEINPAVRRITI